MEYNPFSLAGKTILITGASSGIGKSVAFECSKMGANIIITGRNELRLNETFQQLSGHGHSMVVADLLHDESVDLLVNACSALDGVVHCAGYTRIVPFSYIQQSDFNDILKVHVVIPGLLTKTLLQKKILRKKSSVIFISSVSGVFCASTGGSMYSASKGALNGMVKTIALELAPKSIRINCICPGMINTSIYESGTISAEQLEEDKKKYPLKRYGEPEEVAYAAVYLLSDASQWVTGTNLLIDGGYTLQ